MKELDKATGANVNFYHEKRVFLTGHTGFKGAWLTAALHELGAETTGYALAPEEGCLFEKMDGSSMLHSVTGDVRNYESVCHAMLDAQPEIVFHFAAQVPAKACFEQPRYTFETNVMGTVNLLEAVRQCPSVKSVVLATTDKVYRNKGDGAVYAETDPLGGDDPYSSSKTCTEYIAEAYKQSYLQAGTCMVGVSTVRASNVLGGGDHVQSRLIPSILRAISEGKPVELRNPHQTRPWQSVLDALNGYLTIGRLMYDEPGKYSSQWNIGPELDGIQDVLWILNKITEYYRDTEYVTKSAGAMRESRTLGLDIRKAKRELKWVPKMATEEMLYNVVDFFKQQQEGISEREICTKQIQRYFHIKMERRL